MGAVSSKSGKSTKNNTSERALAQRRFKDYYISAESIGVGSFASVHRCFRKSDLSEFAVKIIKRNFLTPKELAGLENEMRILRKVSHQNVIKLVDVFSNKRSVSMVLELCKPDDLFDRIAASKGTRLSEAKSAEIVYTMATALHHLHSNGIVHRDVKPENILFSDVDGTLKISDFGLAHYLPKSNLSKASSTNLHPPQTPLSLDDASDRSRSPGPSFYDRRHSPRTPSSTPLDGTVSYGSVLMDTCCGTPHYVAPEVICGKPYDSKCDMWSLGVMLYIMLVGYQPFRADSLKEIYEKIALGDYDFKSKRWKQVSKEARHFVRCLMELDPKKRYSVQEIKRHPWIIKHVRM